MAQDQVTAGIVVIGDEILSGRTRDVNVQQIAEFLAPLGVQVREARIVADDEEAIIEAVNALRARYAYVFTTGGIGPTHDDITADAVAKALGRTIDIREDAKRMLEEWYAKAKTELTRSRLKMARVPEGADLIENPVTGAPGFQVDNVFVLAGVPQIVRGMLEDIDHRIEGGAVTKSVSVKLESLREGDIAERLGEIQGEHRDISIGSYPWFEEDDSGGFRRGIVLVARGTDTDALETVRAKLEQFKS